MKTAFVRYLSAILAVITLLSLSVFGSNAGYGLTVKPFADVTAGSWYEKGALYCYTHGYIAGTSQGEFSPKDTLTRAMAVRILYSVNGGGDTYSDITFSDVPASKWYHNAVEWAYENNVAHGTGEGVFSPGAEITRQDFVTMMYGYRIKFSHSDALEPDGIGISTFADNADISGYAEEALNWAVSCGLVSGYDDNTLRPKNTITRAEASTLIAAFDALFGHDWLEEIAANRSCETGGKIIFTCSVCSEKRTVETKAYHLWNDGVITASPGCFSPGTKTYTCNACGKTYTEALPAIGGHVYGDWTVATHADLYTTGMLARYCWYCGMGEGQIYRCDSYYQLLDKIELPSGGYNVSTENIGLKVIYINSFLLGTTSASYTSSTANAVRRFQRDNGLPATGIVDLATWLAMGYDEYSWYNLGTYITPKVVTKYNTRQDHINTMINVAWEYAYYGTEYRIGCSGPPGTYADCSGLIYQCLYAVGINPDTNIVDHALAEYEYTSRWLAADPKLGLSVPYSDIRPGDLVFYAANGRSTVVHVALYAGDGMIYDAWPNIGTTYRSVSIPGYYAIKIVRVFP